MKRFYWLCLLLLCAGIVPAQFRYSASKASIVSGTYTDLGTSGTVITTANFDNANSPVQSIGFNFYYNGEAFTQFVLNTNGFIKLGNLGPVPATYDVLSSGQANTIAPFNYDLRGGSGTPEYRMLTSGAVGSRVCTIQFEDVRDVATSQYNNCDFQIRLYETTNVIEFVYGTFNPSGQPDDFREMIVGIQGPDSTQSVNATKSSATAWTSSTFINGVYPAPNTKFNNRRTVPPVSGTIFRFTPINDAKVEAVYTLSKIPVPFANPHVIRAKVSNTGGSTLTNLPVTVSVSGANEFDNTQFVTIPPFSSTVVTFASFSPVNFGDNVVTVSVPNDDDLSNNSKSYDQKVNANTYSYEEPFGPNFAIGWGTDAGLFLAKFSITGTDTVGKVRIGLGGTGVGNTIYAVVMNAGGNIVAQSDPYITTASDEWSSKEFVINNAPAFTNTEFYVGLAQTANASEGYFPLGVQEEPAGRPGSFYFSFGIGNGLPAEDVINGRYMISAIMKGSLDASVEAVYTLSKAPRPFGSYQHMVRAKIKNKGTAVLSDYPVTLNITGANTATDVSFLYELQPQDSVNIYFNTVSLMNLGTNTLTVSVPSDKVNINNSATYSQSVNDSIFSYADASLPVGRAGFNTSEGVVFTRFPSRGGDVLVTAVRVYISNDINNIGQLVSGVVWNSDDNIYRYSDSSVILVSDTAKYKTFRFNTPLRFSKYQDIYIGLKQKINALGFNPVGYQRESGVRPGAFYKDAPPYGSLDEFTSGRLMMEAIVKSAPGQIPTYSDELIAVWNFVERNSPASVPAHSFHRNLTSSNLLTRGPGAPASPGTNSFLTAGFQNNGISTSNTDYFQFEIRANAADTLSLSSVGIYNFFQDSTFYSPGGVNVQLAYSLNGVNFTLIGSPVNLDYYEDVDFDLQGVAALQNLLNATKVTFRFYASGSNSTGVFGFMSQYEEEGNLTVYGTIRRNAIIADPVIPMGADFYLANCSSTATGSVNFTSTGTYAPGNVYTAKINTSLWARDTAAVVIGTLASTANSGTINFTIPAGIDKRLWGHHEGYIDIWIESSTNPWAISIPTPEFRLTMGEQCYGPYVNFRSKQSGNWNSLSTWEMSASNTNWIPSTFIPDQRAGHVTISQPDSVTITSPINIRSASVAGRLALLNGGGNNGVITFYLKEIGGFLHDGYQWCMQIDSGAVFRIVSATQAFDDVIKVHSSYSRESKRLIRNFGKISIGDGSGVNGPGFDKFATNAFHRFKFFDQSIFEWNTTSPNGPASNAEYFRLSYHPILRLSKMPATTFGGTENTVINGTVEFNTPVTMDGSGIKEFRDGITGTASVTQASTSGEFITVSPYTELPETDTSGGRIGIISGNLTVNLNGSGLTIRNGVRVLGSSDVMITGTGVSRGKVEVEPTAKMTLDPSTVLTIENADLVNEGIINGTGKIQFTGPDTSQLRSPGVINAKLELLSKQLKLGSHSTTSSIDLLNGSHLRLDSFHLNMRTGNLNADASNFIVTNDTGRLQRYVGSAEVPFHVGINESSYSPVMISNSATPDNFKVRVAEGVRDFQNNLISSGNVNRTWLITDSLEGGSNVNLRMFWHSSAEQTTGFNPNNVRVSRLSVCPLPRNCSGALYDMSASRTATDAGGGYFFTERNAIDSFKTNSFIVTSNPFVYTFTGNGNWSDSLNWTPAIPPPYIITQEMHVIINPAGSGECISNSDIQIIQPGRLTVLPGKKLRVVHQ